ncbi:MAG: tryptophan-rich sensory protein [Planctomycetes bacterium]|nr:tryptophan-rich sensory protein [Planctomycetota bacterium]MCD7895039.1 tryptophan-rich sensory protein [Planctomycetaceae bacterium]
MKKAAAFIVPIVICLLVGYLSSLVQAESVAEWYPTLNKPLLTPPSMVFPIAWNILYILMGISVGLVILSRHREKRMAITLFVVQLLLTFVWCLVFFTMRNPAGGLIVILGLLAVLLAYAMIARHINIWSAILFIPYILWVLFATYLNGYIWHNN